MNFNDFFYMRLPWGFVCYWLPVINFQLKYTFKKLKMPSINSETQLDSSVYLENVALQPLKLNPEQVKRILVCHVSRIGDTLLTSPALRLLAKQFPKAKIDFLGHPKRYQILQGLPYLTKIGSITKRYAPFMGWKSLITSKKYYDLAVVWGHDLTIGKYALRVAKQVLMQKLSNDNDNKTLQNKRCLLVDIGEVPNSVSSPNESLLSWRLKLLQQGLGNHEFWNKNTPADYIVLEDEAKWAKSWISEHFKDNFLVGLVVNTHPVGNIKLYPEREWAIENYAKLCKNIQQVIPNVRFIMFGDKHSRSSKAPLSQMLGESLHLVVDEFTLRQSAAVIAQLNFYIGGDTGPTHIAVSLKVPSVVFFHCSRNGSMVLTPPKPEKTLFIDHPCNDNDRIFIASMDEIRVDEVWEKIKPFIGKFCNN